MDILKNDFEKYTGAAIYALVGSDGKRYIGQTRNYYQRMMAHRSEFKGIYEGKQSSEGYKLCKAVKDGITFKAEILEKIPLSGCTYNALNEKENYYYKLYGGFDGTYNSTAPKPPNYYPEQGEKITFIIRTNDQEIIDFLAEYDNKSEIIQKAIREYMKGGK